MYIKIFDWYYRFSYKYDVFMEIVSNPEYQAIGIWIIF